ncbi:MAG: lysophospholipid transporter LplT, partial [Casimicrobiaceae bacterium]
QLAVVCMIVVGAIGGFFVVPMNALLQHRGHVLMGAGHSIAVQNFNETIGIFVMVGVYAMMAHRALPVNTAIVLFGAMVSGSMLLVIWRYRHNRSKVDLVHLIAVERSPHP